MKSIEVELKAKVASFLAGLKSAGTGVKQLASEIKSASQTDAWETAGTAAIGFGTVALAAGGLAVKTFADFDKQMSAVSATGADAKNNIGALRDIALELGADTSFSAGEAAQGLEELAKAGVSADDSIKGGLKGSLALAAAGSISVAEAAETAASAMTQFKLGGDQVEHVADLMAAGASSAQGGVHDLGQALNMSGLVANQFGLSIEDTLGSLTLFASAGLTGSDAGTSFKSMLLALADPAKETQEKMDDLGLSFYDAQGDFIGMEGVAEQLQTRLGGLTQEQRNAALASIFGRDAIRAASILYEEGAEGVAKYAEEINKQGFAAEMAAEMQNNMVGDLEKLGGAWDTLAIKAGSAADGPLRGGIQTLTNFVDFLGSHDSAATTLFNLTVGIGGLAIAGGTLMKATTGFVNFTDNLTKMQAISPNLAAGLKGVAGGLTAITIAAVAVKGVQAISDAMRDAAPTSDAYAAALTKVAGAGEDLAKTNLEELFAGVNERNFFSTDGLLDFTGMAETAFSTSIQGADNLSIALQTVAHYQNDTIGNFAGINSSFNDASDRFSMLDQALKGASPADAAVGFTELRNATEELGWSVEDTMALVPQYRDSIKLLGAENGIAGLEGNLLADAMENLFPPLAGVAGAASEASTRLAEAGAAGSVAADGTIIAAEAAMTAEEAFGAATDALSGFSNIALALSGSQMGLEAAFDAATDAVKENGKTLDITTEKGRANRSALDQIASAADGVRKTMVANGDEMAVVNARTMEARTTFINTAVAMDNTSSSAAEATGKAEALASSLGLVPTNMVIPVSTPGAEVSIEEAASLNAEIADLPEATRPMIYVEANTTGAAAARAAIDAVKSKTVTITVQRVGIASSIWGNDYADGGKVYGAGGPRDDAIQANLSNKEFVTQAWAAEKIGTAQMDWMNRTGTLPLNFANGGQVSYDPYRSTTFTSGATMNQPSVTNNSYHYSVQGREAFSLIADQLRYATRQDYQENGVHRG